MIRCAIGEEFLYCVKATGFAGGHGACRAGMRPAAGPALRRRSTPSTQNLSLQRKGTSVLADSSPVGQPQPLPSLSRAASASNEYRKGSTAVEVHPSPIRQSFSLLRMPRHGTSANAA